MNPETTALRDAARVPAISVLIPTRNRAALVVEAVHSVLAQRFADLEVVAIDNGSSDDTAQRLAAIGDPRLRVVHEERPNVCHALNTGLAAARGRFVARCDDDDFWLPHWCETLLPEIAPHPRRGLVSACAQSLGALPVDDLEIRGGPLRNPSDPFSGLLLGDTTASIATLVRREALEAVGGWDPELPLCEDWDLALQLSADWEIAFVDRVVARFRRHGANHTQVAVTPAMQRRIAARRRVLDKALASARGTEQPAALRAQAYARVYTGEGHQWLQAGDLRRAVRSYRAALRTAGVWRGAPRVALGILAWFGPAWLKGLGPRLRRRMRRIGPRRMDPGPASEPAL